MDEDGEKPLSFKAESALGEHTNKELQKSQHWMMWIAGDNLKKGGGP